MDDIVKSILQSVKQVWPKAKPTVTVQFFEATAKEPEKFVVTLGDLELHKVSLASEGATLEQAMAKLRENLSNWFLNFRKQEVDQFYNKEQPTAQAYHDRLLQAVQTTSTPSEE